MVPIRGLIALLVTTAALVLLLSFSTPAAAPATAALAAGGPASSSVATAAPTNGATTTVTQVDGTLIQTRYGSVQVRITVADGKLVDVTAIALPSGGRSGQISSIVGPMLRTEALAAGGATIDVVSGATYTSRAYAQSLQAALDQAGL